MADVLVIDDIRIPPFEATVARTWQRAEVELLTKRWDEVWWDHDLGPDLADFGKVVTTRRLALMVEEAWATGGDAPTIGRCFIHTSNGVGARWLYSTLSHVYPGRVEYAEMVCDQLSIQEAIEAAIAELRDLEIETDI